MPRVAPPGEMKTSPACFPGPNVLPIPTATAPPNLPQPCCSAAQCNTLPPHAPSNPASNRPNPGRNPWIEVALGQIGPRGGILGLRSRLARSGPGGPAQPLQVSRLHRHASCLTCDTSPHCTAAHRASTLEAQWPQINQCGLCVELQTHHCRTLHACGPPRPSRQRQSPFQRCLLCRTRAWAIIGVRTAAAAAESDV